MMPIGLTIYLADKIEDQEETKQPYLSSEGFRFFNRSNQEPGYDNIQELDIVQGYQAFKKLENDISSGKHHFIVDFDMHFEDISLDFTNQDLNN
ncbi:mov34 mpn pad-1 family protein, putative [Ichthyophthirius multifiliis]|uniref:Mov34 mpn pad-1 family protein, putative n=1 Tax=Ichthyophthirius multifiliis TaxID=5932 RepID=G0R1F3_ICHMU|nr:mov34 mpn pad-1 family protein, putative [Ichthyophthirius multifiliis]EGR28710.1 mov34 mpn pad-1 family protein, putative [Ichthyophthirius multifiliis]|eukprot:XP_004029946.1 mov34 mpn pad-1 family protein, putative [Ichthyophthirius multifiliis]